jgi:hypothetical protein
MIVTVTMRWDVAQNGEVSVGSARWRPRPATLTVGLPIDLR